MAELLKKVNLRQTILKNNDIYKCKCGKYQGIVYARIKQNCGMCRSIVKSRKTNLSKISY